MLAFLLSIIPASAFNLQLVRGKSATIIVPDDYPTIQEAINAARPGDTIFVRSGNYYESVFVNKSVSLVGEDRRTTIIDAEQIWTTVIVRANEVSIANFTIRNSGPPAFICWAFPCILLYSVQGCNISNNEVIANWLWVSRDGIILEESSNNSIYGNNIVENRLGIHIVKNSDNNHICGNNVTHNGYGIFMSSSRNNLLKENRFVLNRYNFGVWGNSLPAFVHHRYVKHS